MSSYGWLSRPWAIQPSLCPECGDPRGVGCFLAYGEGPKQRWGMLCLRCSNLDLLQSGKTEAYIAAIEEPWTNIEKIDAAPGIRHPSTILRARSSSVKLSMIDEHNSAVTHAWVCSMTRTLIWARKPGLWRVDVREDGTVWLPWEPGSSFRNGEAVELSKRVIRASRFVRRCAVCQAEMEPGPAWRPKKGSDGGWSRKSLDGAMVCDTCVRKAREKAIPVERPRLRLISGGASE